MGTLLGLIVMVVAIVGVKIIWNEVSRIRNDLK